MFTGLIQAVGSVLETSPTPHGRRLVVGVGDWEHEPSPGDSISVSGCCLTVADFRAARSDGALTFDVIAQTLAKTVLGSFEEGTPVNLEHALTPTTLLGGHFVQGHVDGVGRVLEVRTDPADWRLRIEPPAEVARYLVPTGSVAIDGVSLTIAALDEAWFEVALIPATLEKTTLDALAPGRTINLEADLLAKTVVQTMERFGARGCP